MQTNVEPQCFGKEWSATDIDCTGGVNPTYRNSDGGRYQAKCSHYDACKVRSVMKDLRDAQRAGTLISPDSLVRGRMASPQQGMYGQPVAPYQGPQSQPSQPAPVPYAGQPTAPQSFPVPPGYPMYPPQAVPAQYPMYYPPPPGYPIPTQMTRTQMGVSPHVHPYLVVPEPRKEGAIVQPLMREMVRAMFKASGQTFANFWDFTPLGDD